MTIVDRGLERALLGTFRVEEQTGVADGNRMFRRRMTDITRDPFSRKLTPLIGLGVARLPFQSPLNAVTTCAEGAHLARAVPKCFQGHGIEHRAFAAYACIEVRHSSYCRG